MSENEDIKFPVYPQGQVQLAHMGQQKPLMKLIKVMMQRKRTADPFHSRQRTKTNKRKKNQE